ncbi:MAG: DUF3090 domain-containing protein [Nostocoides sp.]
MSLTEYDPPERFVAGTVGPPGSRTFFLQARRGSRMTSLSLEKEQVGILAERVNDLLDGVQSTGGDIGDGPVDNAPLDTPIEDDFRINTLALAWDFERRRVVIECHDNDPDEEAATQAVRIVLAPEQARAFARRALELVAAGRPPCPFCGGPLDVTGHICPRANGYRR